MPFFTDLPYPSGLNPEIVQSDQSKQILPAWATKAKAAWQGHQNNGWFSTGKTMYINHQQRGTQKIYIYIYIYIMYIYIYVYTYIYAYICLYCAYIVLILCLYRAYITYVWIDLDETITR